VVGLHVATALALIAYFWRDWQRIVKGFFSSLVKRRAETPDERASWFIVIATIPVGILGVTLEHGLRTLFAKPLAAANFLMLNGLILLFGEWIRRRRAAEKALQPAVAMDARPLTPAEQESRVGRPIRADDHDQRVMRSLRLWDAFTVGFAQSAALLAGLSRDGICMVTGLFRGLTYEDAARFAFLLSAPPILAAGLLKIPDLMGNLGNGIRGQVLAGSAAAFITALLSVRFLVRYFQTRTLTPFAVYSLALGASSAIYFGFFN